MTKIPILFKIMGERKISAKKLSDDTGISTGNISDWKSGRSMPSGAKLQILSKYFDVSTDYLLGREEQPKVSVTAQEQARLSDDEEKLLEIYRGLTETQKALVLDRAQGFSDLNEAEVKKDSAV